MGRLIGVGNGNPNSLGRGTAPYRAFSFLQSTGQPGAIVIEAVDARGWPTPLMPAALTVTSRF